MPDDSLHAQILRLLCIFHKINAEGLERTSARQRLAALLESVFINNKLTPKLTCQREERMIVARYGLLGSVLTVPTSFYGACLPDSAVDLPQHYPFLFSFTTHFSFLQSTSFGYARLILK